jgi:hypothetical protein
MIPTSPVPSATAHGSLKRPGAPNLTARAGLLEAVLQVMGQASDADPSCLDAFAELDAVDLGWHPERGGQWVSGAAGLVADQPVALAQALRGYASVAVPAKSAHLWGSSCRPPVRPGGLPGGGNATVGRRQTRRGRPRPASHGPHGTTGPSPTPPVHPNPQARRHPHARRRSTLVGSPKRQRQPNKRRSHSKPKVTGQKRLGRQTHTLTDEVLGPPLARIHRSGGRGLGGDPRKGSCKGKWWLPHLPMTLTGRHLSDAFILAQSGPDGGDLR